MKIRISLLSFCVFLFLSCSEKSENILTMDDGTVDEIETPTENMDDDEMDGTVSAISNLKDWLGKSAEERNGLETMDFATESLTKAQADSALLLIQEDAQAKLLAEYSGGWDRRIIDYKQFRMPFFFNTFGSEPSDGRSLYISLHGGGGAPASVNDQQYENQKRLYDATMRSLEGIYLAPRAPTNVWNLWHLDHIDDFLNIIIQMAVIKENVNPNRVYILGYSAGGDGLYQLAPRMADRWAAASMMAGHPNDASPLSLRNTPFSVQVGDLDTNFNRNGEARNWGVLLAELKANDSQGYEHFVEVREDLGHWMNLEDAVALPWMATFERNPIPEKVVWKQDDVHHDSFYWLNVPNSDIVTGGEIIAEYNAASNQINIDENYSNTLNIFLNDAMFNLDEPVTVSYKNNTIYEGIVKRTILNIYNNNKIKGDINLSFSGKLSILDNATIRE